MLTELLLLSAMLLPVQTPAPGGAVPKPVLANAQVTAWNLTWTPGRPAALPDIPDDSVTVFLDAGTVRVRTGSGAPKTVTRRQFEVVYEKAGGPRTVEAVDHAIRAIVIDLKPGPSTAVANTSGYPDAFPRPGSKLLFENGRVASYEYTFVAGRPSPLHFHPRDVVTIYTADGAVKSTTPAGESVVNDHFVGQVLFNPKNRIHTEELARGDVHIVTVELK